MDLPNSAHGIRLATPAYSGAWFRDLDLDKGLFRTICDVADATFLHDGQVVLDASATNDRLFGCPAEELIGRPVFELLQSASAAVEPYSLPQETVSRMRLAVSVDGVRAAVLVYEVPVWCHGRSVNLLAVREARKCNVVPPVGESAGWTAAPRPVGQVRTHHAFRAPTPVILGIAHDLNSMLTTLLTGLDLLERRGMDPAVHQCAIAACRQATTLVSELITVGMGAEPACPLTNLGEAIERAVSLAARGADVDVQVDVDEGLWPVYVNEARFERVIYNLALNAVQAMPRGGSLLVTANNTYVHQPSRAGLVAGRAVRVSVKDSGPGIPSAALANIFEPYFTTKREGMGIGLAASRDLIADAGGDITVDSTAGHGTTFHTYLPAGVRTEPPPPPSYGASEVC